MERIVYERPRERLQRKGVSTLTLVELVQVVIGSGNSRVSAARIAKNVANLIQSSSGPSYDQLLMLPGVGDAKACLIMASIELGLRLANAEDDNSAPVLDTARLQVAPSRMLLVQFFDASGKAVGDFYNRIEETEGPGLISLMLGEALSLNARSIIVAIGYKDQSTSSLDTTMLDMLHKLYESSALLQIRVGYIEIISASSRRSIRQKDIL